MPTSRLRLVPSFCQKNALKILSKAFTVEGREVQNIPNIKHFVKVAPLQGCVMMSLDRFSVRYYDIFKLQGWLKELQ